MTRFVPLLIVLIGAMGSIWCEDSVQLTTGPGNDTEAAWSPDGRRIAFQTDRNGDLDLCILDVETKEVKPLVGGPGHACFPAWSPDGKWIAYAYAHFTKTAFEKNENGYNLFIVPSDGGEPRRLTSGLFRDYAPVFGPDGNTITFSSARHPKTNAVSLSSIPITGGEIKPVVSFEHDDEAAVQPDFSADGRLLAYAYVRGFRENWSLRIAKTSKMTDAFPLSDSRTSFYGPRWSPKERLIACTGYQVGDPGWNVYFVQLDPLRKVRVTDGPGNSRSPAWSPDGKRLVFENNRTGAYKLYAMPVPDLPKADQAAADESQGAVLRYDFAKDPGATLSDLSEQKNIGAIHGAVSWQDGALSFTGKDAWIAIEKPRGFVFGKGTFCVRATVSVPAHTNEVRILCVGEYPNSRNGWQLYLGKDNRVYFNSRDPEGTYKGAVSEGEAPVGRPVTLVGVRLESGVVKIFVDGALERRTAGGAFMSYPEPNQVRIGAQWNGDSPFNGRIHDLAVYTRDLTSEEVRGSSLRRFLMD
ncbi:MAG: LamG-like jellyroll fold domain-containing protein [Planctomycetota bacterium]